MGGFRRQAPAYLTEKKVDNFSMVTGQSGMEIAKERGRRLMVLSAEPVKYKHSLKSSGHSPEKGEVG